MVSEKDNVLPLLARLKTAVRSETDAGLAKALGISQASVAASKKKQQIPPVWIVKISKEFGVSADWLLYGSHKEVLFAPEREVSMGNSSSARTTTLRQQEGELIGTMSTESFRDIAALDSFNAMLGPTLLYAANDKPIVSIPILDSNDYTAIEHGDEYYEFETSYFRASWIAQFGNPEKMFLFIQKDDSMLPQIHKGDAVLVDRRRKSLTSGNVLVIAINDDISIRKVERMPGTIVMRATNKDYIDIEIDAQSVEKDIVVVGNVLWWCHSTF